VVAVVVVVVAPALAIRAEICWISVKIRAVGYSILVTQKSYN